MGPQVTKTDTGKAFNRGNRQLERLILAIRKFKVGDQVLLGLEVCRSREGIIVLYHDNHLPELGRDPELAPVYQVVVPEDRAGKDRQFKTVLPGVLQNVVLKVQPRARFSFVC